MTIQEMLEKITHREILKWESWFSTEWNEPTKSDQYLMQIAAEVRRVLAKNPSKIKNDHLKIKFVKVEPKKKLTKEEATKAAKARWSGILGLTIK